jgi:hypothetical protein
MLASGWSERGDLRRKGRPVLLAVLATAAMWLLDLGGPPDRGPTQMTEAGVEESVPPWPSNTSMRRSFTADLMSFPTPAPTAEAHPAFSDYPVTEPRPVAAAAVSSPAAPAEMQGDDQVPTGQPPDPSMERPPVLAPAPLLQADTPMPDPLPDGAVIPLPEPDEADVGEDPCEPSDGDLMPVYGVEVELAEASIEEVATADVELDEAPIPDGVLLELACSSGDADLVRELRAVLADRRRPIDDTGTGAPDAPEVPTTTRQVQRIIDRWRSGWAASAQGEGR